MIKIAIYIIIVIVMSVPANFGQPSRPKTKIDIDPVDIGKIVPSDILGELRKIRGRAPHLTGSQMALRANRLIRKMGSNFTIPLLRKPTTTPHLFSLKAISGRDFKFEVDEPHGSPCHETVLNLPIMKIGPKVIVVVRRSRSYSLKRPQEFEPERVTLLDRSLKKALRKWYVPIDAVPVGVSRNGRNLYFAFEFTDARYQESLQFEDLVYEISSDGRLRFVPANDSVIVSGKRFDFPGRDPDYEYMRFRTGNRTFVLKFLGICT